MKKTCRTCKWFVEGINVRIGRYSHAEAKKLRHGFCLKKFLQKRKIFLEIEPEYRACRLYQEESKEK